MPPRRPSQPHACSVDGHIDAKGSTDGAGGPDRVIATLAQGQHGVVARRQLLERGLTADQIDGRVRRGRLHPVHRGVYAVGHPLLSGEGRWLAAVLACGPGAVLSHRSAAALWGIAPRSGRAIEVTRASGWRAPAGIAVHRCRLPADEVCAIDGIPATGLARTFLDLAAVEPRRRVEAALNEAEVLALTDSLSIPALLKRYPRRPGTAALRDLMADEAVVRGITRQELERRFAALLAEAGLPPPRRNAHLAVRGRFFEVDCLWEGSRVIVELDGRAAHGTRRAFERDRERDRLLQAEGWRVVRVTWRQLRDDSAAVLGDLRGILRSAAPAPTLRG